MIFQRPSHGGLPLCSSNNKPCRQTDSLADKTRELHHITHVDGFQGCTRREWDNWECSVPRRLKAGGGGTTSLSFTTHLEKIQTSFLDVCSKRVKGNGDKMQWGKVQVEISGVKNHHEGSQTLQYRVCETSIIRDIQSLTGQGPEQPLWHCCEKRLAQRSPEGPFNLNCWGISQNHKMRAAHEMCTLPYHCSAVINYTELQRQQMYLCERLQESIFWEKNKDIWWVNLK